MTSNFLRGIGIVALSLASTATVAQETSDNRVAALTDWSVFVESDPTECWIVSTPKETVNTREGRVVSVNRSEILMFVTYRPSASVSGEVSFTGGYPFAEGSTVQLEVSGTKFEMFTTGENAWPASAADDAKIITAMKRGAEAKITGRSSRGTVTTDTFSLYGFSAALDEAENRCVN